MLSFVIGKRTWDIINMIVEYLQMVLIGTKPILTNNTCRSLPLELEKPRNVRRQWDIYDMIWYDILYYQNRFRLYSKHQYHGMNGKRHISIRQTKYLVKNSNNDKHECKIIKALNWGQALNYELFKLFDRLKSSPSAWEMRTTIYKHSEYPQNSLSRIFLIKLCKGV